MACVDCRRMRDPFTHCCRIRKCEKSSSSTFQLCDVEVATSKPNHPGDIRPSLLDRPKFFMALLVEEDVTVVNITVTKPKATSANRVPMDMCNRESRRAMSHLSL